jgi:hypothetical protein
VALINKQYYYKIIETGMGQFGISMNFLWIKQVLMIIFTLKITFHIYSSNLTVLWTAQQLPEKEGSLAQEIQDTVHIHTGRGIPHSWPLDLQWTTHIRSRLPKTVCYGSPSIHDQRHWFKTFHTTIDAPDRNPTAQIHPGEGVHGI